MADGLFADELITRLALEGVENVVNGFHRVTSAMDGVKKGGFEMGKALVEAGNSATTGLTVPLVRFGQGLFSAAASEQALERTSEAVFGKMTKEINDWAETAAQKFGESKEDALKLEDAFGQMFSGLSGPARAKAAEDMAGFTADLASFADIDPSVAQAKITAAINGSSKALKPYGIDLTTAARNTEAYNEGLGRTYAKLTAAQQQQVNYNLIMRQSGKITGNFAKNSDDARNASLRMHASMQNLKDMLAQQFLPIGVKIIDALTGIIGALQKTPDWVQKSVVVFGVLAAAFGPLLIVSGYLVEAWGALSGAVAGAAVETTAATAGEDLMTASAAQLAAATDLLAASIADLAAGMTVVSAEAPVAAEELTAVGEAADASLGPIGLIIGAIVALGVAYKTNFLGFGDAVNRVAGLLSSAVSGGFGKFRSFIHSLTEDFDRLKTGMTPTEAAFAKFGIALGGAEKPMSTMRALLMTIADALDRLTGIDASGVFSKLADIIDGITSRFDRAVALFRLFRVLGESAAHSLRRVFDDFFASIKTGIGPIDFLEGILHRLVNGFIELIDIGARVVGYLERLWHFLTLVAKGGAVSTDQFKKMAAPLRALMLVLGQVVNMVRRFMDQWQKAGFLSAFQTIPKSIRMIGRALQDLLDAIGLNKLGAGVRKMFNDFSHVLDDMLHFVRDIFSGQWGAAWGDFLQAAQDAGQLLLDYLSLLPRLIVDAFNLIPWKDIWDGIVKLAKDAWKALKKIDWGGIWSDIKDFAGGLIDKLTGLGSRLWAKIQREWATINWNDLWQSLGDFAGGFLGKLGDLAGAIWGWVKAQLAKVDWGGLANIAWTFLQDALTAIAKTALKIADWSLNVGIPAIGGWLAYLAADAWGALKQAAGWTGSLVAMIADWSLNVGIPAVGGWPASLAADAWTALKQAAGWTGNLVANIFDWSLYVGIPALIGPIGTIIGKSFGPWMWGVIKKGWDGSVQAGAVVVYATVSLSETVDFSGIGKAIADGAVAAVVDVVDLGSRIASAIAGAILDYKTWGLWITKDSFNFGADVGVAVHDAVVAATDLAVQFVSGLASIIGTTDWTAIAKAVGIGLLTINPATLLVAMAAALGALSVLVVSGLAGFVVAAFGGDEGVKFAKHTMSATIDAIKLAFTDPGKAWDDISNAIVHGLGDGISEKWTELKDQVNTWVRDFVGWFKDALKIASPSQVFHDIGKDIVEGLKAGAQAAWDLLKSVVDSWLSDLKDKFQKTATIVKALFDPLKDHINTTVGIVKTAVADVQTALNNMSAVLDPVLSAAQSGIDALTKSYDALHSALGWLLGGGGSGGGGNGTSAGSSGTTGGPTTNPTGTGGSGYYVGGGGGGTTAPNGMPGTGGSNGGSTSTGLGANPAQPVAQPLFGGGLSQAGSGAIGGLAAAAAGAKIPAPDMKAFNAGIDTAIAAAKTSLAGLFAYAGKWSQSIGTIAGSAGTAFNTNLSTGMGLAVASANLFTAVILRTVTTWATNVGNQATTAGTAFNTNLSVGMGTAVASANLFTSTIVKGLQGFALDVTAAATSAGNAFNTNLGTGLDAAKTAASNARADILTSLSLPDKYQDAYDVGYNIGRGLNDGIGFWVSAIAATASAAVTGAITAANKAAANKSPSKKMHQVGSFMAQGLINALNEGKPKAHAAAAALVGIPTATALGLAGAAGAARGGDTTYNDNRRVSITLDAGNLADLQLALDFVNGMRQAPATNSRRPVTATGH